MMRTLEEEFGIQVHHAWGMTEMSPTGSVCHLKEKHGQLPAEVQRLIREKQGKVIYGVDWRIVDGDGKELPWDGVAFGDLQVRGPWVVGALLQGAGERGLPMAGSPRATSRRSIPTATCASRIAARMS